MRGILVAYMLSHTKMGKYVCFIQTDRQTDSVVIIYKKVERKELVEGEEGKEVIKRLCLWKIFCEHP